MKNLLIRFAYAYRYAKRAEKFNLKKVNYQSSSLINGYNEPETSINFYYAFPLSIWLAFANEQAKKKSFTNLFSGLSLGLIEIS